MQVSISVLHLLQGSIPLVWYLIQRIQNDQDYYYSCKYLTPSCDKSKLILCVFRDIPFSF